MPLEMFLILKIGLQNIFCLKNLENIFDITIYYKKKAFNYTI